MKKFKIVAYSGVQYAPALCLWCEAGETECIDWQEYRIRVGYMDDAGSPDGCPRWHRIYTTASRGDYIRYYNRRYYINDFIRV